MTRLDICAPPYHRHDCVGDCGQPAHRPTPHVGPGVFDGGVRCSCGEDFIIGRAAPDTPKGKPSKRRIKKMEQAWAAWRDHAYPPEAA